MKNITIVAALFILLQLTSFGQMQKFSKQNPDSSYKVSFLLADQHTLLFFWYSGSHLLQSRSTDAVNWSDAIVIKDSIAISSDSDPNEITGIVLNSGRIFLVFRNVFYYSVYSDDNGESWSVPLRLPTGTTVLNYRRAHYGNIIQTSTGKLILVFSDYLTGSTNIRFITSSDNGSTWSTMQTYSGPAIGTISTVSDNKLILVYQKQGLFSSFSTDDGVTWDSPGTLILNDTVNTPKVVTDQSGNLWLFYQRIIPSPFQGICQQDILYKISRDGGLTWSDENNFTRYRGFDGYYNISGNFNNPPVSFSSGRVSSSNTIYNLWYGTAGLTDDINTPPCIYKYVVSNPTPYPGEQFNIDVYVDYSDNAPTVSLNRTLNGITQSPLTMYDDGTHGDTLANDKIYTCEVPGLALGVVLQTTFNITDQTNSFLSTGPSIAASLPNSVTSTIINVNNFKLPVENNGILADVLIPPETIGGGKYEGKITLFCGGFFMSGYSNGKLWSNGEVSTSRITDFVPGKVGSTQYDPNNILYTVKSTDPPFGQSWQNWKFAVDQGAAFYDGDHDGIYNPVDLNGNGKWDPNEDRPDLLGDMTTWCVYNDALASPLRTFNDVSSQGIEIQQTVFAQKDSADLNNVIFVKYRLINKGIVTDVLDSVYFGLVNDIDIGDSGENDLDGCDTLLNSGYTYHKTGAGDAKWGTTPPAETITLLQGPESYIPGVTFTDVNGNGIYDEGTDIPIDTAYSFGGPLIGKTIYPGAKNLNISSYFQYYNGIDPATRFQCRDYTLGLNYFESSINPCTWSQGTVIGVDCSNINPAFMYSGDPVNNTGWVNNTPRDQRMILNTGPFKLEKDKPIDIMAAYIVCKGTDYLNSVSVAKKYAASTVAYYNLNFPKSILTGIRELPQVINNFNLCQNYPNPFNPSTIIKYSVGTSSFVSIKVYNILGREVAVLLNEQKNPGEYEITFNSAKYNLASGVYFYKLSTGGFTSVKKMLLLK